MTLNALPKLQSSYAKTNVSCQIEGVYTPTAKVSQDSQKI